MKKSILALVVVLAFVVLAGTVSAAVKEGDKEITFSGAYADLAAGSGSDLDSGHVKATILSGSFGYFVSDAIELSAKGMVPGSEKAKQSWMRTALAAM